VVIEGAIDVGVAIVVEKAEVVIRMVKQSS